MIIDIVTLFPDMLKPFLTHSIIGKAIQEGLITINLVNLRDYTLDKHKKVDDTPYGGGNGMILTPQPVFSCLRSLKTTDSLTILTSPQGKLFSQEDAFVLSKKKHLIILCGHYEGFDERINTLIDQEISIGDYVLTGGEIPALVIMDSVSRLIKGVIDEHSHQNDSFSNWMLEHPQYTKPRVYEGLSVPMVLLNGNHQEIKKYQIKESLRRTYLRRPDLINKRKLTSEEIKILEEIKSELG